MRYMQIVKAANLDHARNAYLELLSRRNIGLAPGTEIYVETVHRRGSRRDSWLCYCAMGAQRAA